MWIWEARNYVWTRVRGVGVLSLEVQTQVMRADKEQVTSESWEHQCFSGGWRMTSQKGGPRRKY